MKRARWIGLGVLVVACVLWFARGGSSPPVEPPAQTARSTEPSAAAGSSDRAPLPTRTDSPADALSLSGRVETRDGAPVAGIQVAFRSLAQLEDPDDQAPERLVRTDANGRFSLAVSGPGYLSVVEGARPSIVEVDGNQSDIAFLRGESCALEVTVVDAEGQPVPGYGFGFFYRDPTLPGLSMGMPSGPYETNADGRLRLDHAPCGALRFESAVLGQEPMASVSVDTLLEQSVTLKLLASVQVDGTLVDADGEAVSDATVSARWTDGVARARVEADGQFSLKVPPEEDVHFHVVTESLGDLRERRTAPSLDDAPWSVELRLLPVRPVTAQCPDDGEECRAQDAPACVWEGPDPERRLRQDCRLGVDRSSYDCLCGPDASQILSNHVFEAALVEAGVTEVTLTRRASALEGMERWPVQGRAALMADGGPCEVAFALVDGRPGRSTGRGTCGADGQLQLELPAGQVVQVQVDQGDRTGRILVEMDERTDSIPPIVLGGTASLTVTLVGDDGEFVSSGFVSLEPTSADGTGVYDMTMFGSAAGAHFAQLPAGSYAVLGMGMQSSEPVRTTVTLAEGEALEVELEP